MEKKRVENNSAELDLSAFIDSIPTADAIRDRLSRNAHESAVLKKLLRLAIAAEEARAAREACRA